ncbi:hypothetical protein AAMO2058_000864400 [Amorphochlora amoebiformis]
MQPSRSATAAVISTILFLITLVSPSNLRVGTDRGKAGQVKHAVLWFRNDLRVHDNAIFHHPAVRGAEKVTPVFVFDPRQFEKTPFGSRKTGIFRARFLKESVEDLKRNLKAAGSDLAIFHSKPEDILPKVAGRDSVVVCQEEVTSEELRLDTKVDEELKQRDSKLVKVWGPSLYHPDDIPFDMESLPEPFTAMRNQIEKKAEVEIRPLLPDPKLLRPEFKDNPGLLGESPSLEDLGFTSDEIGQTEDKRGVLPFKGGETEALKRLSYFTRTGLKTYKSTRNGLIGENYSSKYSPWLANGCLSPRMVYWKTREYEEKTGGQTVHTYWLIFELLWRDYMRFFCVKHGNAVFHLNGPRGRPRNWNRDSKLIRAWKEGNTGVPWVDANMRELRRTGFMSNRGRQNVASYLVHDLGVDWRFGADHFESLLLDHDVCSNYGNWVAAAGLTGGRINRFNMSKQASDYDKQGDYVKLWCPELKGLPAKSVHHPWLMSSGDQRAMGCVIGQDYPAPVKPLRKVFVPNRNGNEGRKDFKKGKAKGFRGKGRVHRGRNRDFITN